MDLQLSNSKKKQDNPQIVAMFNYLEQALKDDEKAKFESIDTGSLKSDSSFKDVLKSTIDEVHEVNTGEHSINEVYDDFDDPQAMIVDDSKPHKQGKKGFQEMADAYQELQNKEEETKKYQDLSETDKFLLDQQNYDSDKESKKLLENLAEMDQAVKKLSENPSGDSQQPKGPKIKKTVGFARQQTNQESDAVTPVSQPSKGDGVNNFKKSKNSSDLNAIGRSESFSKRESNYGMQIPDETPRDTFNTQNRYSDKKKQADMTAEELEAYKQEQKLTFRQQRTHEKKGIQLNQNDQEVLDELRERLVNVMNMDPEERQKLLYPAKGSESESKGLSALQKLKEKRNKKNEDAQNATQNSQVAGSEAFSPASTQVKGSDREHQGQDSNYTTQFSPRFQLGRVNFPSQKQISLNSFSNNPQIRKVQMTRKIDEMLDENKKKEKVLLDLKKQLESYQVAEHKEKQVTHRVKQQVAQNEDLLYSPKKVYQATVEDQLMDVKATKMTFDFTNLDSCIETKEVIHSKIMLVESRQRQEDRMNYQLHEMVQKLNRRYLDDQKERLMMTEKCENMNVFVNNLIQINNIQGNRMLDIENLDFEFSQKLEKDKQRVIEILQERKIILKNHQHDVQQILFRLLKHLRVIKQLKIQNQHIEYQKRKNAQKECDMVEVFKKRNKQIEMLQDLGQLQQLKSYSDEMDHNDLDNQLSDDDIRARGLNLIKKLKMGVEKAKDPNFDQSETYIVNQPSPNKSSPNYSHRAGSSNISGRLAILNEASPGNKSQSSINSKIILNIVDPKLHQQTEHQQILAQIENYSSNREYYDEFYSSYFQKVEVVDIQTIVETFLMSTIKLNSLQASHKSQEVDKIYKIQEFNELKDKKDFLHNEQRLIGDFIQNLDIGDPLEPQLPQSVDGMILYNEGLDIKNKQHSLVTKGRFDIYIDFVSTLRDQMVGITSRVKIFKDFQDEVSSPMQQDLTVVINRYQNKIVQQKHQHGYKRGISKIQSTTQSKSKTTKASKQQKNHLSSGANNKLKGVLQQSSSRKVIETDLTAEQLTEQKDNSNTNSCQSNKECSALQAKQFYQTNEENPQNLEDFIINDQEDDTVVSHFQIQDSNSGSGIRYKEGSSLRSPVSPKRQISKRTLIQEKEFAQAAKYRKRAHSVQAEKDQLLQDDLMAVLRSLIDGSKDLNESNKVLTAEQLKLRHLGTIRTGKVRGQSPTSHNLMQNTQSVVVIDDFDPIYRKKDFYGTVQKNVHNMMNFNKNYTKQQYEEMREEVKERLRVKTDEEKIDQDLIDFLAGDPRIQTDDVDQKQKDALKNKLQSHQKYNVKEHLWRSKVPEASSHRHQMNRKKMNLDNVQREEKEFLNKLKEKLSSRYGKLKQSIERDYDMYDKRKQQFATIQNNQSTGKSFNQNSQNYDYNISIKSPNNSSSQYFSPRGRTSQGNKTATAKQRKMIEDENYIKPLKSACFDMEVKKAPATASLKERIKLNSKLTLSPKTGMIIGVKPKYDNSDLSTPGLHTTMMTRTNNNGQTQQNFKKTSSVNILGAKLSQSLVDRVKKQAAVLNAQTSMNNLTAGAFSSNKAYNLTYKTDPRMQLQSQGSLNNVLSLQQQNSAISNLQIKQQNSVISNANIKGEFVQQQVQDEHFMKYYASQRGSAGVAQFHQQGMTHRVRGRGNRSSIQYNMNRYKTSQQMRMDKAVTYRSPQNETMQPKHTKVSDKFGSTSIFASNRQMMSDAFKNNSKKGIELTVPMGGNSTQSTPRESPTNNDRGESYLEIPDDLTQPQKRLQTAGADRRGSKYN